jgi:Phage portal protein, lambda family
MKLPFLSRFGKTPASPGAPLPAAAVAPVESESKIQVIDRSNLWWSVYEAAERNDFGGYFWLPNLTPSEQMNSLSERAIAERSDYLYKNVGASKPVIDGLALYESGTGLWPSWITGQEDFDKAMTDAFHYSNHEPRVFSADGCNDAYSVQYAIRRMIRLYGDCWGELLRPSPGTTMPSMALYPGYLVDNAGDEKPDSGWQRGVLRNKLGRAIKYRVLDKEHSAGYHDVDANDLLHFHDPFLPGEIRGTPALASVIPKLFKREDIYEALSNGTLSRAQIGWAIETDAAGFQGPAYVPPGGTSNEKVTQDDGTTWTLQKVFGANAGKQIKIPELPPGKKIVAAESKRPEAEVTDFQDSYLRETAFSTLYPISFLYFIANGSQGTLERRIMQQVKAIINSKREFQLKPQFLNRWHVFFAWHLIKSDYFAALNISVPNNWWQHRIVPPADMTLDVGREGRLMDERVESNKMPIEEYHESAGNTAGAVEDGNYAAIKRRCGKIVVLNKDKDVLAATNGLGFTYDDLHPRGGAFNNASAKPATAPTPPPATPPPLPRA